VLEFVQSLPPGSLVGDIGCGNGLSFFRAQRQGIFSFGLGVDVETLAQRNREKRGRMGERTIAHPFSWSSFNFFFFSLFVHMQART
jgi:cyclopropane fatty-acyl-phospholipid synthase-like methyltransferase